MRRTLLKLRFFLIQLPAWLLLSMPLYVSGQLQEIPYESDSTCYRIDLALNNPERCHYLFLEQDTLRELPASFTKLTALKGITFRYCLYVNWEQVISQLSAMPNLRYVEISICNMKTLPENTGNLSQIASLNLKSNLLTHLPASIRNCSNLKYVNLSFNRNFDFNSLAASLLPLPALTMLDLSNNLLLQVPNHLQDLPHLESLQLADNKLTSLPDEWKQLKALHSLDLSNNPSLDYEEALNMLSLLPSLKQLIISNNDIRELPEAIGKMNSLESLNLSGNQLRSLPKSIEKLVQLKFLDLGMDADGMRRNKIRNFPAGFNKLVNLEVLNLSGDSIIRLPAAIAQFSRLRELDARWCTLFEISEELRGLKQLEVLKLGHNHINKIPEWIGELTSLKVLDLEADFFTYPVDKISMVPPSIGNLQQLEKLILSDQVIRALPSALGACRNLKLLDLRNNLLVALPDSLVNLSNLSHLNVKANTIEKLPAGFEKLASLRYLNLSFNEPLDMPAAARQLQHLHHLEILDISFNRLDAATYNTLKRTLPDTQIIAKGFNNLVPIGK